MKILLTSAGFRTNEIVEECSRLVGKSVEDIKIAIVNEAHAVEVEDKHWIIDELSFVSKYFAADIDFVNLLALPLKEIEERLLKSDVIYVLGGNSDYLKSLYDKIGLSVLLAKLLETKLYVGSSAGSMIMCKRLDMAVYREIYGMRNLYKVEKYLEFADFSLMPHLDSPHFKDRRTILDKVSKNNKGIIYGINDNSAISIEDHNISFIGDDPYIWGK